MSEKPEKVEITKKIKEDDEEDEVEEQETVTTTRKGPLGFNFNDPIVLAATVLGVSVIGIVGYNLVRNFIWAAAPPTQPTQQQKPANVTVTPEQLRQAQYQRDLEMASHNLFATNMNTIETNNKQLKQDGVHYYDQFFNQYERKPAETTTFEDDIMIVDDNNEPIVTVSNQKQTYYKPAPPTVQVNRPTFNTRPPPPQPMQKIESQEVINDEDITMITSNEPDLDKIPKEFVSVGNSETEFDRIESQPPQNQQQQQRAPPMQPRKQTQEVDFENLEIDSDTLKQMEANAYTNNDYY